ncbi:hypothetical protein [Nonomuraea turcica]|uniref:hypothetical protein n=1 Tax=Nonomuraea sp. G32 TaxID=3067274 RepID=UPI00273C0FB4|nr:hypothetical protein [Nonomuraea sp. G32]MDP4501129.1 hypothetical protein [Nonomuraea sp. G32]
MQYKKWIVRAAIAFAAFYLLTKPANAADAVNGAFDGIMQGADQLATFFSKVLT